MSKPSRFAEYETAIVKAAAATRCKVCNWLDEAASEDAAFISGLLALPLAEKGHKHISKVLASGGVQISADAIKSHRDSHLRK